MSRYGIAGALGLLLAGAIGGTVFFASGTPGSLPSVPASGKAGQVLVMKNASQAAGSSGLTWDGSTLTVDGGIKFGDGTAQTTAATSVIIGATTTATVGNAIDSVTFIAPAAGIPVNFGFDVKTPGLGAGNVTISFYDITTSIAKGSATFACTATGFQAMPTVTSPAAWTKGDIVRLTTDDSACTVASAPIGVPEGGTQAQ